MVFASVRFACKFFFTLFFSGCVGDVFFDSDMDDLCSLSLLLPCAQCNAYTRLKVGITDGFVRVSCGIEDTEDLLATLKKGLDDL